MKKHIFLFILFLLFSLPGCSAGGEEVSPTPEGFFEIPIEGENVSFEVNTVYSEMGYGLVAVRLLEDGHYIGYALILPDRNKGDAYYKGTVVMSEYFPKTDGEYQNITKENLDDTIAAAMQEKGLCEDKENVMFFAFSPNGNIWLPIDEGDVSFEVRYAGGGWPSAVGPRMMEVRFLEDGHYIGFALIYPNFAREDYAGEVIAFQEFPKVDGEYQDITEEELDAAIAEAREEYRVKKVEERLKEGEGPAAD